MRGKGKRELMEEEKKQGDVSLIDWPKAQYWSENNGAFNPYIGCVADEWTSPACANCYAREMSNKFGMADNFKLTKKPNAKMPNTGVVFCGNMSDLWVEQIPDEERKRWFFDCFRRDANGFALRDENGRPWAKDATFLWLTKRVPKMVDFVLHSPTCLSAPNCWWGMTGENQEWYDKRVEHIRKLHDSLIPDIKMQKQHTWLSAEPLLGDIDLGEKPPFEWVVVGCESGKRARPCDIGWICHIVKQCQDKGIAVFVKQLPDAHGHLVRDIEKFPEDLRIRQMPFPHEFGGKKRKSKKSDNN